MTSDLDIYRTADVLVKRPGRDVPIHAAMRADAMLEKGDLDGYGVWKRKLRAVEELQGAAPKPGEALFGAMLYPGASVTRSIALAQS